MNEMIEKEFAKKYIEAWSTIDSEQRKTLVDELYSTEAHFYANEPGDKSVEYIGIDKIYENITQVNKRLVIDAKLDTECSAYSKNHNILKVAWSMKGVDGNIVMRGMNFLIIDKFYKIQEDYIFID